MDITVFIFVLLALVALTLSVPVPNIYETDEHTNQERSCFLEKLITRERAIGHDDDDCDCGPHISRCDWCKKVPGERL